MMQVCTVLISLLRELVTKHLIYFISVLYHRQNTGVCIKLVEEKACQSVANELKMTMKEVFNNSNPPYPPGCYIWTAKDQDHGVYYNSALNGNVSCTSERECLCESK